MRWEGTNWRRWAFVLATAGVATAGYAVFHLRDVRHAGTAILRPAPEPGTVHQELRTRILRVQHDVRQGWRPVRALGELAALYHANGFYAEAAAIYTELLRVDPSNSRWPHLLAGILAGFGELENALPLLRRTVALDPSYLPAQVRLGDALLKTNSPAEAGQTYREVLKQDPENGYAQLGLARIDIETGDLAAARDRLQHLVSAQPSFGSAWFLLATLDERLRPDSDSDRVRSGGGGRFREMPDPWTDELLRDCYDVYRLRVASETAAKAGDAVAAQQWLERALVLAPADAKVERQLGSLFLQAKSFSSARLHLERAVELAPEDADNWNHLIALLTAMGEHQAADHALMAGLARCPQSPSLHYERGRRLSVAGRFDEAIMELEEARRLRPEAANAIVELAMINFRRNQVEAAVLKLREALACEPSHPLALVALAQHAVDTGDLAASKDLLRRVRHQPKVLTQDLNDLAVAFEQKFGSSPW